MRLSFYGLAQTSNKPHSRNELYFRDELTCNQLFFDTPATIVVSAHNPGERASETCK